MAIIAPTFDFMKVSPANDGLLYKGLSKGNRIIRSYGQELNVTASGLTATVGTGAVIVEGRLIINDASLNISIPSNTSGYIVATVDLSKTNTFSGIPGEDNYKPVNNQARIEFVKSLVQQDIHTSGKIYNQPIAKIVSSGSSVTVTKQDPEYARPTFQNNWRDFSGYQFIRLYKDGDVVTITGAVANGSVIQSGADSVMFTIPEEFRPTGPAVIAVQQMSGNSIYTLQVNGSGECVFGRARNGASSIQTGVGTWILVNFTWSVKNQI